MKSAMEIFNKYGAHYYENDESVIIQAMEEYAAQFKPTAEVDANTVLGDVDALREKLARLSHERFRLFVKHILHKCICTITEYPGDIEYKIPVEYYDKLKELSVIDYHKQSEPDKDSDRLEADEIIKLLKEHIT